MSVSPRNAVFLDEMGIGALWQLRDPGTAFEPAEEAGLASAAAMPAAEASDAAVPFEAINATNASNAANLNNAASASSEAMTPAPGLRAVSELVGELAPELAADPAAAAPGRLAAAVKERMSAPAPASSPASAPASPSASASIPAPVPARAPAPAPAADDESMAWFDDVPAAAPAPRTRAQPPQPLQPVSDAAIAAMDWPELQAAVSGCTRCPLASTRLNAVNGRGPARASWLAITAGPTRQDEADVTLVTGEAGQLLDNMLRAIALAPEADVYVTGLVKCRPATADGADRAPTADELTACRPYLDRELALAGATMTMTFGQVAARGLMMGPAARGKVMRYGAASLPVVATYHPDDLLRRPEDKAKAWGDLCLTRTAPARD